VAGESDPATKAEMADVFGRVFDGGLALGEAAVERAITPRKPKGFGGAKKIWRNVLDPHK